VSGPLLLAGTARVRVPATSANLGPGFDALGLALSLSDEVSARVTTAGVNISVVGEGADGVALDESHLVLRSMRASFDRLGVQPAGLELVCANRIPHGRGLGSSAAAIVAGVLLARALVDGGSAILDDAATLVLADELEGHPDNVAACLLGGLTIAWTPDDGGGARAIRLEPSGVRPVVCIPVLTSSTAQSRQALPPSVPHVDAAFNAARAALLVAALTVAPECLLSATEDRLHQQYRAAGLPATAALVAALRAHHLPAVVSGAGPTVLVLTTAEAEIETVRAVASAASGEWQVQAVDVAREGAVLLAAGAQVP
jgi:homoserine kinase